MRRRINIWNSIDKMSFILFLLMILMGWVNIYAAVYNEEQTGIFNLSQRYGKQALWIIATLIMAIFVVLIDNRFYFFFSWFIYGITILMLLLVLVVGREINGARSWFEMGNISLQPSEFAKFGTSLALARYLSSKRHDLTKLKEIIPAVVIIMTPAFLIALQPDMGSGVVYLSLFIVLFREGMSPYVFVSGLLMVILFFLTLLFDNLYVKIGVTVMAFMVAWIASKSWRVSTTGIAILLVIAVMAYVAGNYMFKGIGNETVLLIAIVLAGGIYAYYIYMKKARALLVIYLFLIGSILFVNTVDFAFNNLLKPHQQERVSIMMGLKSDPHGTGYNVNQSLISIGSGGVTGKGYLQGTQTKFKFVPAQSTDFIFCTVGEEWGFIGSFVVIGMYLALLLRLVFLAERQRSMFAKIYGYCVMSILFIHFFINIGMVIGIIPVIGIPLPFFSYGGSSLWGFTILLFVFLRLDASRTEYLI